MISNIANVGSALATLTSLTITTAPNYKTTEGYNLMNPVPNQYARLHNRTMEIYPLKILSTSIDALETAIALFLTCDSHHGSGYNQSNAAYPIWIEVEVQHKDLDNFHAFLYIRTYWSV